MTMPNFGVVPQLQMPQVQMPQVQMPPGFNPMVSLPNMNPGVSGPMPPGMPFNPGIMPPGNPGGMRNISAPRRYPPRRPVINRSIVNGAPNPIPQGPPPMGNPNMRAMVPDETGQYTPPNPMRNIQPMPPTPNDPFASLLAAYGARGNGGNGNFGMQPNVPDVGINQMPPGLNFGGGMGQNPYLGQLRQFMLQRMMGIY